MVSGGTGYPYAQQEQQPQQPQWLEQQPPAEAVPPAWLYEAAPPLPVDDAPPLPSEMPPPLPEYQYPVRALQGLKLGKEMGWRVEKGRGVYGTAS
jgi:hypothetical protein